MKEQHWAGAGSSLPHSHHHPTQPHPRTAAHRAQHFGEDAFDPKDQAAINEMTERAKRGEAANMELMAKIMALGEKIDVADDKAAKRYVCKKKAPGKAQGARVPVPFDTSGADVDEDQFHLCLPPGFRLWRDDFCKRWQVRGPRAFTRSRSWHLYGKHNAALHVLQAAWTFHGMAGRLCPIAGLFAEKECLLPYTASMM